MYCNCKSKDFLVYIFTLLSSNYFHFQVFNQYGTERRLAADIKTQGLLSGIDRFWNRCGQPHFLEEDAKRPRTWRSRQRLPSQKCKHNQNIDSFNQNQKIIPAFYLQFSKLLPELPGKPGDSPAEASK